MFKDALLTDVHDVYFRDFVTVKKYSATRRTVATVHKRLVRQRGYQKFTTRDKAENILFLYRDRFEWKIDPYLYGEQIPLGGGVRLNAEPHKKKKQPRDAESVRRSINRIKQRTFDILNDNRFSWFVTFTVDKDKCCRYSMDDIYKLFFRRVIAEYNKGVRNDRQLKYLLVPEFHADGAIHLHGFLKGVRRDTIRVNEHGYYEVSEIRDSVGFMNMKSLKGLSADDYGRTVGYILKYIEKAVETLPAFAHAYYCSKGFSRGEVTKCFYNDDIEALVNSADFVTENEYIKKAYLSEV